MELRKVKQKKHKYLKLKTLHVIIMIFKQSGTEENTNCDLEQSIFTERVITQIVF